MFAARGAGLVQGVPVHHHSLGGPAATSDLSVGILQSWTPSSRFSASIHTLTWYPELFNNAARLGTSLLSMLMDLVPWMLSEAHHSICVMASKVCIF